MALALTQGHQRFQRSLHHRLHRLKTSTHRAFFSHPYFSSPPFSYKIYVVSGTDFLSLFCFPDLSVRFLSFPFGCQFVPARESFPYEFACFLTLFSSHVVGWHSSTIGLSAVGEPPSLSERKTLERLGAGF